MKRIVPILAVLLLVANVAFADNIYIFCEPQAYVNVRSQPSGIAIGWVECGNDVSTDWEIKKRNGKEWIHVIDLAMEETEGWICTDYVSTTPIIVESRTAYACPNERVAIRKSPNGKLKRWLYNGDKTNVIAWNDEWAITTEGYVKVEFLDFVTMLEEE